jgi:hypothetical protein
VYPPKGIALIAIALPAGFLTLHYGEFQQQAAFPQRLKRVVWAPRHHLEYLLDERQRHVLLKEIAHGVDEDKARRAPPEPDRQCMIVERQLEAAAVVRLAHGLKISAGCKNCYAERMSLRLQVQPVTGFLGCLRPFDRGMIGNANLGA